MEYDELAKKYMENFKCVNCYVCGKDLYYYDDFECSKRGKKYVFIHKDCLKLRGGKNG